MRKHRFKSVNGHIWLLWGGLILLGAAAFLLPNLLFRMQDARNGQTVGQGERDSLSVAWFNSNHEENLRDRLRVFASGINSRQQYQVIETKLPEEYASGDILMQRFAEEENHLILVDIPGAFVSWPQEDYFLSSKTKGDDRKEGVSVDVWKRYMVYDAEHVNFFLWYLEYSLPDGEHSIQLLMDEESGTIYYMQGIRIGEKTELDAPVRQEDQVCFLSELFDSRINMQEFRIYFNQYYQTDLTYEGAANLTSDTFTCPLPYEKDNLIFEMYYNPAAKEDSEGRLPEIRLGIVRIAELIPDMRNRGSSGAGWSVNE